MAELKQAGSKPDKVPRQPFNKTNKKQRRRSNYTVVFYIYLCNIVNKILGIFKTSYLECLQFFHHKFTIRRV